MRKFRHAVFCYFILRNRALLLWILNMRTSRRHAGLITIGDDIRDNVADWALKEFFEKPLDFNVILHILGGDEFYERNKRDVLKIQRATGKPVIELWDTDPIFAKYPHLRSLARNREFEAMWSKMKQR